VEAGWEIGKKSRTRANAAEKQILITKKEEEFVRK
jgi:hypothetical protein